MKLYITNLSILVLVVFYIPLVCLSLWLIWRAKKVRITSKMLAIVAVAIVGYGIPMADVTVNSLAMFKACPVAGLHVYRKVQAEGYYDIRSGLDQMVLYGYRFIETKHPGDQKITRFEKQSDGKIVTSFLDTPSAEYEIIYEPMKVMDGVRQQRWWVRRRSDGEAVGEWLWFGALPGWVDRILVLRWFGDSSIGECGDFGELVGRWYTEIIPSKKKPTE